MRLRLLILVVALSGVLQWLLVEDLVAQLPFDRCVELTQVGHPCMRHPHLFEVGVVVVFVLLEIFLLNLWIDHVTHTFLGSDEAVKALMVPQGI